MKGQKKKKGTDLKRQDMTTDIAFKFRKLFLNRQVDRKAINWK